MFLLIFAPPSHTFAEKKEEKSISARKISKDDKQAIEIFQGEYAITSAYSDITVIQTWDIWSCIGLTLYDKESKIGVMAHFNTLFNVPTSMEKIFNALENRGLKSLSSLEARIIGGAKQGNSRIIIEPLKEILDETGIEIVEEDTMHFWPDGASIQLDTKTGAVTDYKEEITVRKDEAEHINRISELEDNAGQLIISEYNPFKI